RLDWSRYATGGLVGLLAAVLVYQGVGEARRGALVKVGEVAPALVGTTLQGQPYDFGALRGKAVVVDFWESGCEPCRHELPDLVKLAREYGDRGAVLVMADYASNDNQAAVEQFVRELMPDRLENVHVVLAEDESFRQYQVQAFPTTYFVNRQGMIVDHFRGLT